MDKEVRTDKEVRIVAGDTDSVVGSSVIIVDGEEISIEEYFNSCSKESEFFTSDGSQLRKGYGKTFSINMENGFLEEKTVSYCMKHKVKKEMFEITVGGDSVIVTEDHSIIVEEDGLYFDVSPSELRSTMKVIKLMLKIDFKKQ